MRSSLGLLLFFKILLIITNKNKITCFQSEFSVIIEPNTRECFHQVFTANLNVYIDFQVISGGELDISFWLSTPSNRVLVSELHKNIGQHQFKTEENGEYRLCFDNSFSRFATKQVFFYLYTPDRFIDPEFPVIQDDHIEQMQQDQLGELEVKVDSIKQTFTKMQETLEQAQRLQSQFRIYENIDRGIMEMNFERVNFWSVINVFVLLIVAFIQVIMIRSLFEDKSKIGRLLRHGKAGLN